MDPISYGCLQNFIATSKVMIMEARTTRKSGSTDEDSGWAQGREAFAIQVKRQIIKADRFGVAVRLMLKAKMGLRLRRRLAAYLS